MSDLRQEWFGQLRQATATEQGAMAWREGRSQFARELKSRLLEGAASGPILYGVWVNDYCVYVGQSLGGGKRRIGDLVVGESHHLANTFPPEIWTRMVAVNWGKQPGAPAAISAVRQKLLEDDAELEMPAAAARTVVSLALEAEVTALSNPLFNSYRRTRSGIFSLAPTPSGTSRVRVGGAVTAFRALASSVVESWKEAAELPSSEDRLTEQ